MKAQTFFNQSFQFNKPLKCVSTSTLSAVPFYLQCWRLLSHAGKKIVSWSHKFATWITRIIRTACLRHLRILVQDKRFLIGGVGIVAGVTAFCAGPLFFDPMVYDHAPCLVFGLTDRCYSFDTRSGWCFMSWYILLENTRVWIVLIFFSLAGFFFIPKKFSGMSFVFFSITGALGWVNLLHIIGYARSHETFRAVPAWEIILSGVMLASLGILLSNQAITYWEHHKKRGNWQKWPAIYRSSYTQEEKNRMFEMADKEYDQVNKMI